MASNTPPGDQAQSARHSRSASRSRAQSPPPRPTTPLRPPSRNSLRSSYTPTHGGSEDGHSPLAVLEAPFGELSDSMADLEANFVHLQLMHESLARFSECFASFLYGLNVNAFCVDFPEAPVPESFRRARDDTGFAQANANAGNYGSLGLLGASDPNLDPDQTFLTTDTSFVENPPLSTKPQSSQAATPARKAHTSDSRPAASSYATQGTRGARTTTTRRGAPGTRGRSSGLARATSRGRASQGR